LRKESFSDADLKLLNDYRQSFGEAHETVVQVIRKELRLEPSGRPEKSTGAIIAKLLRGNINLSQIQDIAGCRLVVEDIVQEDAVVASLQTLFPDVKVVDRRVKPSHGYRAVHVIPKISGKLYEIQIRTNLQHLWARYSEALATVFGLSLKYGGGDEKILQMLARLSKHIIQIEQLEMVMSEYEQHLIEEHNFVKPTLELKMKEDKEFLTCEKEDIYGTIGELIEQLKPYMGTN
jgi:ppGpp synthetase/RelA/SpoT-type nucleotidyltranferase